MHRPIQSTNGYRKMEDGVSAVVIGRKSGVQNQ
jgi:hypothetical protein